MAKILQGTPVSAPITPGSDDTNVWPTHFAKYGAGGVQIVADMAARDAIQTERREEKGVLILDADGIGTPKIQSWNGSLWQDVAIGNTALRIIDKDDAVLHNVGTIKFANAALSTDAQGDAVVTVVATSANTGVSVIDKDGVETTDATKIKFKEGVITTDSSGNTIISIPVATGSSISVTDGFGKKIDTDDLLIKNSLLTSVNGQDVLEIATGIEVKGIGQPVDGVKQLEFPQGTVTHDDQNGDTSVTFPDATFTVRGSDGSPVHGVKDIEFKRANVYVNETTGKADVTTLTGVDVGINQQTYTGLERLNFNDCSHNYVTADGSLYITPESKTTFVGMDTPSDEEGIAPTPVYTGKSNKVNVYSPLLIGDELTEAGTLKLEIEKGKFEDKHSEGYLAYLTQSSPLQERSVGANDAVGYMKFDNIVCGKGLQGIVPNVKEKTVLLQDIPTKDPNETLGTPYYVGAKINSLSAATVAGKVVVSIVDIDNPTVAINDVNGKALGASITLKIGEQVGDLFTDGVIKITTPKTLKVKVESTAGNVVINGKAHGMSGMVVQSIESNDKSGFAMQQWGTDTGITPFITAYPMPEGFVTLPSIKTLEAEGFTDGQTHAAKTQIKTVDNWLFYSEEEFVTKTDADTLYLDGSKWFYMGNIIDNERTQALAALGGKVRVKASVKAYQPNFYLVQARWEGTPDSVTYPIATGYDQSSAVVYGSGWKQVTSKFITADITGKVIDVDEEFTIAADAHNTAFFFIPVNDTATSPQFGPGAQFGIQNMTISPINPTTHYVLEHLTGGTQNYKSFSVYIDKDSGTSGEAAVLTSPTPIYYIVTGSTTITKGYAPIYTDGFKIHFKEAGSVLVNMAQALKISDKETSNNAGSVRFFAELFSKDGSSKGVIDASRRFWWLPGNHATIVKDATFPVEVKEDDYLINYVVTDRADEVVVEYLTGTKKYHNVPTSLVLTYLTKAQVVSIASDAVSGNNPSSPMPGLDLGQFDKTYTYNTVATKFVSNASKVTIPLEIPAEANMSVLGAVKQLADTSVRPVASLDWIYSNVTKTLTVSFGETIELGMVNIGVYL